ncbi:MAG: hypothetical protein HYV07_04820 [Deltaproteobacteria bacterium]|nr:hypothetical protein [Deltaproteobacteria bacterium]
MWDRSRTKTIALFDVVGIKKAFESGDAARLLTEFWTAADAWTNAGSFSDAVLIPGTNTMQVPSIRVRTFSDSAVMTIAPELSIQDFHRIALGLKGAIERRGLKSYVVIGRDEMIGVQDMPALGMHLVSGDMTRAYENIIGSGPAWVNVYLGDQCVGRTKEWHDRFSVYAVGDAAVPSRAEVRDQREFRGHEGRAEKIYALG